MRTRQGSRAGGDGPIVSPEEIRSALERSLKVVKEGKLALIDTVTQPR
jgi:hypothetical protein